jgi:predicted nucleic acid-binding protein
LRFWDSSAVLPLIFDEESSDTVADFLREDADVIVWWGTRAECAVAISRLRREGELDEEREESTRDVLDVLTETWIEIRPTNDLRLLSTLLSKYHPLRTADCFQFAAALRWCEGDARDAAFVCLDDRLRNAARKEGFDVLPARE